MFKIKNILLVIVAIILGSCSENDIEQKEVCKSKMIYEGPTTLSIARAHNQLLYFAIMNEPDQVESFEEREAVLDATVSHFDGANLFGIDIKNDNLIALKNSDGYNVFRSFSYENLMNQFKQQLISYQKDGRISSEFVDLMSGIVDGAIVTDLKCNDYIDYIFPKLNGHISVNAEEEKLLQIFTYQLIYSDSFWNRYYGEDIDYAPSTQPGHYKPLMAGLADGAGGVAVGLLLGNAGAGVLAGKFASYCMKTDIEMGKICCCMNGHNPCAADCVRCQKHKAYKSNMPIKTDDKELELGVRSAAMLNSFLVNHPPLSL